MIFFFFFHIIWLLFAVTILFLLLFKLYNTYEFICILSSFPLFSPSSLFVKRLILLIVSTTYDQNNCQYLFVCCFFLSLKLENLQIFECGFKTASYYAKKLLFIEITLFLTSNSSSISVSINSFLIHIVCRAMNHYFDCSISRHQIFLLIENCIL